MQTLSAPLFMNTSLHTQFKSKVQESEKETNLDYLLNVTNFAFEFTTDGRDHPGRRPRSCGTSYRSPRLPPRKLPVSRHGQHAMAMFLFKSFVESGM
jgi:hypothetical protein